MNQQMTTSKEIGSEKQQGRESPFFNQDKLRCITEWKERTCETYQMGDAR